MDSLSDEALNANENDAVKDNEINVAVEENNIDQLENQVLLNGDTVAYESLYIKYFDKEKGEFFSWALIMANKYDYTQAYFDCFYCLFEINCAGCNNDELNNWSLDNLDDKTIKLAIDYLSAAADRGHTQAIEIINIYKKEKKYL